MLLGLYVLWVVILGLVIKLMITRHVWRHPLRGNGPMLWALLLALLSTEIARAHNLNAPPPKPYLPSLIFVWIETFLILYWLWRQLELIPRWIRTHVHRRRNDRNDLKRGRRMLTDGDRVTVDRGNRPSGTVRGAEIDGKAYVALDSGTAGTYPVSELLPAGERQTKAWPPEGIEHK